MPKKEVKGSYLEVAWLQMPLKSNRGSSTIFNYVYVGLKVPVFRVNDQVFSKLPNSKCFDIKKQLIVYLLNNLLVGKG